VARDHHVVECRQLAEEAHVLERPRDPALRHPVWRQPGDVLTAVSEATAARRREAGDEVEHRGLAGAVGPDVVV